MGILNRKVSFRLFAVGLILVLAVIFIAVCVPVFREDIRETGRAAVREAVLRSAVECYTLEGAYPESLEYLEKHYGLTVQELYGSETSEEDIQTFLLEKEQETGAFCCDNNVFREIVNLHVREMRRNDTPAALMIVRLANRSVDPEKRAVYMKQMEGTLLNELRAGDPFTKVGANQFWVLLPGATGENGGLVSRRVFNRFQKEYPKSGAAYTFKSLDLRHIHMSAEEKATEKTERRKA